jgi:hypothetical protein
MSLAALSDMGRDRSRRHAGGYAAQPPALADVKRWAIRNVAVVVGRR